MNEADPTPALDPDARAMLALIARAGHPPLHALSPDQARRAYRASIGPMQRPEADPASVADARIPTAAGELPLRIYRGRGTEDLRQAPALLYLHGGGWVIGGLDTHDRLCRRLANTARIVVVAVDYRLAPEHPYPAAVEDAADAWRWLHAQAQSLDLDPHALAVGGDSAGGNLAAVLALLALHGELPPPVLQLLIYPVLDLAARSAAYGRVGADLPLSGATMEYFIGHYLPDARRRSDWRASPARAADLRGSAPAVLLTVGHDPLVDEGRDYARRLEAAGVRVHALHCADQMHGLLSQTRLVPAALDVVDHLALTTGRWLRQAQRTPR